VEVNRDELARFFEVVLPHLNEMQRRVVAGANGRSSRTWRQDGGGRVLGTCNTVIKAEREESEGIEPTQRQRALGGGDPQSLMMGGIRVHPWRRSGLSRFGELTRSLGLRRADLAEMDLTVVIYGGHAYP
jgi:hypothetical protein